MATILVVEPHADTRELYAEFLRAEGLRAITADSTDQALTLAAGATVIVTELRVPGSIDGLALIRTLKADRQTARTPILVLSASAYATDISMATAAGCQAFLRKPCLPGELLAEVQRLIRHARQAKAVLEGPDRRRRHTR